MVEAVKVAPELDWPTGFRDREGDGVTGDGKRESFLGRVDFYRRNGPTMMAGDR